MEKDSPDIRLRWTRIVGGMGDSFKIFRCKFTGKRSLRRPMHRCEDNIRMCLKEIGVNRKH